MYYRSALCDTRNCTFSDACVCMHKIFYKPLLLTHVCMCAHLMRKEIWPIEWRKQSLANSNPWILNTTQHNTTKPLYTSNIINTSLFNRQPTSPSRGLVSYFHVWMRRRQRLHGLCLQHCTHWFRWIFGRSLGRIRDSKYARWHQRSVERSWCSGCPPAEHAVNLHREQSQQAGG